MKAMNVLFIGGVYATENEQEIINNSLGYVEFSANLFQKKLIDGFRKQDISIDVLSAPLIGAYPFRYKKWQFSSFSQFQNDYMYVPFINIWGVRNFSRTYELKKQIHVLCKSKAYDLVVVYSAHEPFLSAGVFAKHLCTGSRLCFIVPDLPQYMNLNANRSKIYDFFKKYDIEKINRLTDNVDSFVILTESMKDKLNVGKRAYIVVEGIVDESMLTQNEKHIGNTCSKIVYTGKMNAQFGVIDLVDAFSVFSNENCELILCGDGDAKDYIISKALTDSRVKYMGQVTPERAKEFIRDASILVNPRKNEGEYTKYSFPSKTLEYLCSGNPVVAYMLSGYPKCYSQFIYCVEESGGLQRAIEKALCSSEEERKNRYELAHHRLCALLNTVIVSRIIEINS